MRNKKSYPEHTKLKIAIISAYVEAYAAIMLNVGNINIFDLFAGKGKDVNNNYGIAVESIMKIIRVIQNNQFNNNIRMHLNDISQIKLDELQQIIQNEIALPPSRLAIIYTNKSAQMYIEENLIREMEKAHHNLIILDPYGYTQVVDIKSLMNVKKSDYVLFIPLSQLYRFSMSRESTEIPDWVKNFCASIGDRNCEIIKGRNEIEIAENIRKTLENSTNKNYVLNTILYNKDGLAKGRYQIACVTDHGKGADTFLRSIEKAKSKFESDEAKQLKLDLVMGEFTEDEEDKKKIVREVLQNRAGETDNVNLYYQLLSRGIVVSNAFMKKLKDDRMIEINRIGGGASAHSCVNYDQCNTLSTPPKTIIRLIGQNLL